MHYLIDGHNLIGSNLFDDIRLSDVDDEAKLVRRLKVWQSRGQGSMTVIFDRGIPGGIDVKMGNSGVEVVFAANPAQADDLIRRRLRKAKQGLILVTNDEALLREAAVYGVVRLRGVEFVERMKPKVRARPEAGEEDDVQLSKREVEEWLALFRARAVARKQLKQAASKDGAPPTQASATAAARRIGQAKAMLSGDGRGHDGAKATRKPSPATGTQSGTQASAGVPSKPRKQKKNARSKGR